MKASSERDHEAIVIGLGGIGSAAAYWLARRHGDGVMAVEQFESGHNRGGSEDHSRIIRLSYHTPEYVELAKLAWATWEEVEVASGEPLVLRTGGLDLTPPGAAIDAESYRRSLTVAGVPFENLNSSEVMQRWPQWRLPADVGGIYHEQAGLVMASRANETHRRLATESGARIVTNRRVEAIREHGGGVDVTIDGNVHRAQQLVLAAGAWTNQVLSMVGAHLPLEVTLEQVVYMIPDDSMRFHPARFPVWIWLDEPCFYGFPVFGSAATKVGWDRCQVPTDPETRSMQPDPLATRTMTDFVDSVLPGAHVEVHAAKNCLYTLTPDRDFIIDRVPGSERMSMAVGAGHAFKFASLIGRLLADIAAGLDPGFDLRSFRADRSILKMENPPRITMV